MLAKCSSALCCESKEIKLKRYCGNRISFHEVVLLITLHFLKDFISYTLSDKILLLFQNTRLGFFKLPRCHETPFVNQLCRHAMSFL